MVDCYHHEESVTLRYVLNMYVQILTIYIYWVKYVVALSYFV